MAVARSGGEGVDVVCTESQGDDKQTLEMEGGRQPQNSVSVPDVTELHARKWLE